MRTVPVNQSGGPLPEGIEPVRWMFMGSWWGVTFGRVERPDDKVEKLGVEKFQRPEFMVGWDGLL